MSKIKQEDLQWSCRLHPTDWFHEVGCPHMDWTKEQLLNALLCKKQFENETKKIESVDTKIINIH